MTETLHDILVDAALELVELSEALSDEQWQKDIYDLIDRINAYLKENN